MKTVGVYTGVIVVAALAGSCESSFESSYKTYRVDQNKCDGCGNCLTSCNHGAITVSSGKATISSSRCHLCGKCVRHCDNQAISYS